MPALSAPAPSGRIVDAVHAALRGAILDGSLVPGQALSVPALSRQLDVSRSPVREAVLALVADGLAVEQPGAAWRWRRSRRPTCWRSTR